MNGRRFLAFLLSSASLGAVACTTSPPDASPDVRPGHVRSAIIGGILDKAHPAVVALVLGKDAPAGGNCSGTIVKTDPATRVGWVATAAHCVDGGVRRVVLAEDMGAPDAVSFPVLDYEADPRYGEDWDADFAMVRILGVDATTPVLPLAGPSDGLAVGAVVTSVGYGTTEATSANTSRRSIVKEVASLTTELVGYEQSDGGVCFGDSGGPVVAGASGAARVVAIHAFVAGGCTGEGYSARVTNGRAFFDTQLSKTPPARTCALCRASARAGNGACASLHNACRENDACRGSEDCIASGKDPAGCAAEHPLATGPLLAVASCSCGVCADVCGDEPACVGAGRCGTTIDEPAACASCIEGACCEAHAACTADGRCHDCVERDSASTFCQKNAPRQALAVCVQDKCATACAGSRIATVGPDAPAPAPDVIDQAPASEEEEEGGCRMAPAGRSSPWLTLGTFAALVAMRARRRRIEIVRRPAAPWLYEAP